MLILFPLIHKCSIRDLVVVLCVFEWTNLLHMKHTVHWFAYALPLTRLHRMSCARVAVERFGFFFLSALLCCGLSMAHFLFKPNYMPVELRWSMSELQSICDRSTETHTRYGGKSNCCWLNGRELLNSNAIVREIFNVIRKKKKRVLSIEHFFIWCSEFENVNENKSNLRKKKNL